MHINNSSKKKWDNTIAKHWQGNVLSPWRPSSQDITNYKKGVNSLKRVKNILILGATPELRNLASQFRTQVWVLDSSLKMISEMSKLIQFANLDKEKWLSDDWSKLKSLKNEKFDVILGDLVLRLIPFKKQAVFLKKISETLTPKGIFITRIHFVDESLKNLSINEIIKRAFSLLDPNVPGRGTYVKNILISQLLDQNYLLEEKDRIKRKIHQDLKIYFTNNSDLDSNKKLILQGVLNRFEKNRLADFSSQTRKEINEKLNLFFKVKKELIADDYKESNFFLVYILKKLLKNEEK